MVSRAYAVTLCDCAVNADSAGNLKLGRRLERGLTLADLELIRDALLEEDPTLEPNIVALHEAAGLSEEQLAAAPVAHILYCPRGARALTADADVMRAEMQSKELDDRVISYGREVTRHRRKNCCIGEIHQDAATFTDKRGKTFRRPLTFSWDELPEMRKGHARVSEILRSTSIGGANIIYAEVNLYEYSGDKSNIVQGVAYHADNERKVVFAMNLADDGCKRLLEFRYFDKFRPIGRTVRFSLEHADLYVMDEAATGTSRLKHRAGKEESFAVEDVNNRKKWEKKDAETRVATIGSKRKRAER